jgi:hypothetical protein
VNFGKKLRVLFAKARCQAGEIDLIRRIEIQGWRSNAGATLRLTGKDSLDRGLGAI